MVTAQSFISEIESFLVDSGMSPTAFGKAAVGDPSFVGDIRTGRMPGLRLVEKVSAYITAQRRTAAEVHTSEAVAP
jgi:hypothetical protein